MKNLILIIILILTPTFANASKNNNVKSCQDFALKLYPVSLNLSEILSFEDKTMAKTEAIAMLLEKLTERYPNISWADCSKKLINKYPDVTLDR